MKERGGKVSQIMYTHVSKCKHDKIKKKKKKIQGSELIPPAAPK
jgi:hypothetical protein